MPVRQRPIADQGVGQDGLDVFLLGVVQEPGVGNRRERGNRGLGVPQCVLALGDEAPGPLRLLEVHSPDGATGGTYRAAAPGQPGLARRMDGAQLSPDDPYEIR